MTSVLTTLLISISSLFCMINWCLQNPLLSILILTDTYLKRRVQEKLQSKQVTIYVFFIFLYIICVYNQLHKKDKVLIVGVRLKYVYVCC